MPVKCSICGWEGNQIGTGHLKTHNLTAAEYKKKFPLANMTSPETRDLIREKAKLRPPASEEVNRRISESMRKVYSDPKFPLHLKNKNQTGDKNSFFGKTHSKETRRKIGEASTKWLKEAYASGIKESPFKFLGNGKNLSRLETEVFSRVRKFGFKINHPVPFQKGCYKIDFALPEIKFAVELDSKLHELKKEKIRDKRKDSFLKSHGWFLKRIKTYVDSKASVVTLTIISTLRRFLNENKIDQQNHKSKHHPL